MADRALVIPARNEAANLAHLLAATSQLGPDWHVMVVDSGSTDATAAIAQAHGAHTVRVTEPGKGRALATGWANLPASVGTVVHADADLRRWDPAGAVHLADLSAAYGSLVKGRYDRPGRVGQVAIPALRALLPGIPWPDDPLCGEWAAPRAFLDTLGPLLTWRGWAAASGYGVDVLAVMEAHRQRLPIQAFRSLGPRDHAPHADVSGTLADVLSTALEWRALSWSD